MIVKTEDGQYALIDGIEYEVGDTVDLSQLHWSSDWNGYEVGYPECPVVGLYSFAGTEIYMYIDVEEWTILDIWDGEEETE
jgi:hypothetical protein